MSSSSERGWERLLGRHACVAARAAPRPYKPLKIGGGLAHFAIAPALMIAETAR